MDFSASNARSFSVAQLGAMKNLAVQAFSQHFVLGRISSEYADGTLIFNTTNTSAAR